MKILVAGAAGFLGSHMSEYLINKGHEVIGLDNLYTGKKQNLDEVIDSRHFELVRHDVSSPISIECDFIMNFACPASPKQYQKYPVQTIRTNIMGAINLLDNARRLGVPIFQASTSEVYGDPEVHPQPESYWGNVNPIGIRSCYDEGKRVAETLFFDYNRQFDVEIRVARIFNTYGPRMAIDDGRVVSNFIVAALRGLPLTVFGDGTQTRSLCHVDDLIEAIGRLCLESSFAGPMNLGNTQEISILSLAQKIIELSNSKSKIEYTPAPEDDPKRRLPNLELARNVLNWMPHKDLNTGLIETIKYFDELLG